jgi:small-conductance mechanosensitive channel
LQNLLDQTYFGNSLTVWLTALATAVVVWLLFYLLGGVFIRKINSLADRTESKLDDLLLGILRKTRALVVSATAAYVGLAMVELPAGLKNVAYSFLFALVIVLAAIWGSAIITYFINNYVSRKLTSDAQNATTVFIIGFLAKLILWAIALLMGLDNFGVDITALVAGLGISGIAVALAAQNILSDIFAFVSIGFDKPFAIGDFLIIEDYMGVVEQIGMKTTRIRSLSGELLVFSNADLLKSRIRNYKKMRERRILFGFGVTYQTSTENLKAIPGMLQKIIDKQPMARFDRAHFKSFGDSSLDFEVVYYMKEPEYLSYMDTQQTINFELFEMFENKSIEFAYPTQTLFVNQQAQEVS